MKKLSSKRDRYAQERANGLNQSNSYLKAYPTSNNWNSNTLYVRVSELEQRPEIQQRITELRKPLESLLEKNRTKIIQRLIDIGLNDEKVNTSTVTALTKLLDKLLPTKTENKTDLHVKTFEDYLLEWKNG